MNNIKVFLRSKNYNATGVLKDGKLIVKKGSVISKCFKTNYAYSKKVKKYRDSAEYVDERFVVLQDIEFSSPSTASQFVLGYSSNGWKTWRLENREYLIVYKEEV